MAVRNAVPPYSRYKRTTDLPSPAAISACGFARATTTQGAYATLWGLTGASTWFLVSCSGSGTNIGFQNSATGDYYSSYVPNDHVGDWFYWAMSHGAGGYRFMVRQLGSDTWDVISGAENGNPAANEIAWCSSAYGEPWQGDLAGCRVWTAVLTEEELKAESYRMTPLRLANLHEFHPFVGDNVSLHLADLSGNGRTLTHDTFSGSLSVIDGPPVSWGALPIIVPGVAAAPGGEEPGAGAASIAFSATAASRAIKKAAGSAAAAFTAAAVGKATKRAAGASAVAFSAAGVGVTKKLAVGSASFAFSASGVGKSKVPAVGSASFSFGASGTGQSQVRAAGAAAISFAGTGIGRALAKAAGSASIEFVGVGIAEAPVGSGAGASAIAFDAAAVSRVIARAPGSASFAFAGAAVSRDKAKSYAVGAASFAFSAAAVGEDGATPEPPAPAPAPAPASSGAPIGHRVAVRIDGRLYVGSYAEIAEVVARQAASDAMAAAAVEQSPSRTVAKREARRLTQALRARVTVEEPMPVDGFDPSIIANQMFRDLRSVYAQQMVEAIIANWQMQEQLAREQAALAEQQAVQQEMIIQRQRRKLADDEAAMAAAEILLMS